MLREAFGGLSDLKTRAAQRTRSRVHGWNSDDAEGLQALRRRLGADRRTPICPTVRFTQTRAAAMLALFPCSAGWRQLRRQWAKRAVFVRLSLLDISFISLYGSWSGPWLVPAPSAIDIIWQRPSRRRAHTAHVPVEEPRHPVLAASPTLAPDQSRKQTAGRPGRLSAASGLTNACA